MSLLRTLDDLDQMQKLLEEEFPECKISYSYRPGHVTWSAQLGPAVNTDGPDALRDAIKRAYVEVLEKIKERTRSASQVEPGEPPTFTADQPVHGPVTEP